MMDEFDDYRTVKDVINEKKERFKKSLPVNKSAQKEFLRDYLARNQSKFEECMDQLADYDPKAYCTIYKDLMKHMIPKQSNVSVTHGLDQDFKELAALGMTKINEDRQLSVDRVEPIRDVDFEELKEFDDGSSNGY